MSSANCIVVVFLACLAVFQVHFAVLAAPASGKEDTSTYDYIEKVNKKVKGKEMFEGDIVYNRFVKEVVADSKIGKRDSKRYLAALWRTRVVPYEFSADFGSGNKDAVTNAMRVFEAKTCLKFKPHTTERNWLKFVRKDGCYSSVGRNYWRQGSQDVSLGIGCLGQSTVLHEIMHAIGFWHEQSRPDRDKYVEIFWENIDPDNAYNFNRYSHEHADVLGVGYDYNTIMHYGKYAFSMNGKVTMQAVGNSDLQLGQMNTLDATDIIQINALYNCANASNIWSEWSPYGPCDSVCYRSRHRFCSHDDLNVCKSANAYGIESQYLKCSDAECNAPVDGHWGRWSSWGNCSHNCGAGKQNRTRTCSDPAPKNGGKACSGDTVTFRDCLIKNCGLGPYDCEFDGQGWCSWKAAKTNKDSYTWSRITGRTPSSSTGPTVDHTSGAGYYMYAEASSPAAPNDVARVESGVMPATNGMCMSFYYHMQGMTMGTLKAFVKGSDGVETEIWSKTGDQGSKWLAGSKSIISNLPFQVIFEATNGAGYLSDIALDDIMFKNWLCGKAPVDGKWGPWSSWGNCSHDCGPGKQNKTRVCNNPAPKNGGKACSGDKIAYKDCLIKSCKLVIEQKCGENMKPLGCLRDNRHSRVLPNYLVSYRDPFSNPEGLAIDWYNYQSSLDKILCLCAKKARAAGYKYYGLQYYGECWAGGSDAVYNRDGASLDCVDGNYLPCAAPKDVACTGKAETNYIYELE